MSKSIKIEGGFMKSRRIIRIIIMLVSVFVMYMIYRSEYNIKPEICDIERAIEEFLEKDVTVIETSDFEDKIVVYYTLGNNDSLGATVLHRGMNFRYQIRAADYGGRNRILRGTSFKSKGKDYLVVMGTNYDLRINELRIETYSGETFDAKINGKSEILMVFETKEETFLRDYILYNEKGTDITMDMTTYLTTRQDRGGSRFKAELYLLYIYCFSILIIGAVVARVIKD